MQRDTPLRQPPVTRVAVPLGKVIELSINPYRIATTLNLGACDGYR